MRILDLISSLSLCEGTCIIGMFNACRNLQYLGLESFDVLEFWEFLESLNKFDYTDELELVPDPNEMVLVLNTKNDDVETSPISVNEFINLLNELWVSYGNIEVIDAYSVRTVNSVVDIEEKPEVILLL